MARTGKSFMIITVQHGTFGGLCCGRCVLQFLEYGHHVMQTEMCLVQTQWRVEKVANLWQMVCVSLVVHALKGDLDHLAKGWGLNNYNSNWPCRWCLCGRLQVSPKVRYNCFGPDAVWKAQLSVHI